MTGRAAIVSRIYRPEPSAASFFLGSLADSLAEVGHTVDVLTVRAPGTGSDSASHERIRRFPVLRDRSGYVRGYAQYMSFDIPLAFRLLFVRRPSVVFVEPPPTTGAVVRVICGLRRIPYVYDAADIWSDAAEHATSSKIVVNVLRWLEKFSMRGAASIVTISHGVVDRVRHLGVETPITVTGFGADTAAFNYAEAAIEKSFVYAGTYTELHGAEILIDAFALFTHTHPGFTLRFIGNGTVRQSMEENAQHLGIANQVEFADSISPAELAPQLSRAVASLATLHPAGGYEYAFTSKVYSSLASGCPVIFSGPGPTADFIRATNTPTTVGVAVEYSAIAIAEAMRAAADAPANATERAALAAWTAREHSMRATADRVRTVIEAVERPRRKKRQGDFYE